MAGSGSESKHETDLKKSMAGKPFNVGLFLAHTEADRKGMKSGSGVYWKYMAERVEKPVAEVKAIWETSNDFLNLKYPGCFNVAAACSKTKVKREKTEEKEEKAEEGDDATKR